MIGKVRVTSMSRVPASLEMYDALGDLADWKAGGVAEERRQWTLKSFGAGQHRCEIDFRFGDSQVGRLEQMAASPEEAIWLVLTEFRKTESARPKPM